VICFLGTSHAPGFLRDAAIAKGVDVTENAAKASLIFVSEDTPTDVSGKRYLEPIAELLVEALLYPVPVVLTSQVPPGFTRSFNEPYRLYHQAETLRIKDAKERSLAPDYIAVGAASGCSYTLLPEEYRKYLEAFSCQVEIVSYEDAEFSKIAVNMTLAAQVDSTNRLAQAAEKCGASWAIVSRILKLDKRIGSDSYLTPGRWQDSMHLLRDHVTLGEILAR
jgi:UDP-glucose 6-dehydrogenase